MKNNNDWLSIRFVCLKKEHQEEDTICIFLVCPYTGGT